jgi:hypothetical protein
MGPGFVSIFGLLAAALARRVLSADFSFAEVFP